MSWDAYVQNILAASEGIKRACIIGNDDGSIWARSDGEGAAFTASAAELQKFAAMFKKLEDAPTTGFDLEGVHYVVARVDDVLQLVFGKKEKTGIFAIKTKLAIVIACYEGETDMGQECRAAVEKMGAYLQQSGY